MKASEIRKKFTQFFQASEHIKIASSSLVPQNDPTLLFANAGMNQFKDYFTGAENAGNKRATTIQKCVRAGGKHNDLENVGFTARHHTFFEMLGNFSFGDYFKKEAISFAWKFLTVELKIPKDKLYITVHESDQEAADIWHMQEGVPRERIFFLGDKDNFWEMGDIGPCGPCSEIFYDHGEKYSDGADTSKCLLADEGRYVEIWNLVFMQYEKFKDGNKISRRTLPKPSVDTGAGLERISALMQGKYWNYDSDIFYPIIKSLEDISGKKYSDNQCTSSFRVIADHIRSATMLITDGVIPSNEGRGYVLRRIIRRGIRHLEEIGLSSISFYKLIPAVFESLGDEYPQNMANAALAEKFLILEEEKFRLTLKNGLELIKKEISQMKTKVLNGEIAFKLYDTYGFPLDLTETILEEKGLKLDIESFDKAMNVQKEMSKKQSSFSANEDDQKKYFAIKEQFGETKFNGYESLLGTGTLLEIVHIDQERSALFFNESPFYTESGGQRGDSGEILENENILAKVIDTIFIVEGLSAHIISSDPLKLKKGNTYSLKVNHELRSLTAKHHSATHLLQAALINILGGHVKQAGSSVSFDRLRFDFTHPESLSADQIISIEKLVNKKIQEELKVTINVMNKDEATQKGAMALFGEKYTDSVRVLEMGDFSLELCGGTHVSNTAQIGLFKITSESSLSSGIRRIEAVVSAAAVDYLFKRSNILSELETTFSVKDRSVLDKVVSLNDDLKNKNRMIKSLEDKIQASQSKNIFSEPTDINKSYNFFIANVKDTNPKDFRSLSDKFQDAHPKDIALIYSVSGDSIFYLLRSAKDLKSVNCSAILKDAQGIVDGRGGGKSDLAQGSGTAKDVDLFLNRIIQLLKE